MSNILELKEACEEVIVSQVERIEVIDYQQNSGYNAEATVKFFINDEFIADITGGDGTGWNSGELYGDYFEEITDVLRIRHYN